MYRAIEKRNVVLSICMINGHPDAFDESRSRKRAGRIVLICALQLHSHIEK